MAEIVWLFLYAEAFQVIGVLAVVALFVWLVKVSVDKVKGRKCK